MRKTILVTGGAGYIGSHICKALSLKGLIPITYDNLCSGNKGAVLWGPFEQGDIRDRSTLSHVIRKHQPSAVVHCAGLIQVADSVKNPAQFYENNVYGSLCLLEEARAHNIGHILFVSDVEYFKGGAERSLFDLMGNPDIEPMLCVPETGEISKTAEAQSISFFTMDYGSVLTVRRPFKLRDVFRTFMSAFRAARQLKALSQSQNVLCIHSNGLKAHGVACLARLIGGRPVVIHFRAIPFTLPEKLFWRVAQLIASKVILVSRPCWPGKKLPSNVQVIFNGIHLPDKGMVSQPVTKQPFVLGFTGRIQFTKGVDTLIEWFDEACKKGLDIRLIIRGEAAPDERDYEQKCRKMVADKGLEEVCTFEGKREGFDKIYGGLHANVVSSIVPDPLPRAVMESSSLGMPVLAYPAGGIPFMFEDQKSGFLVSTAEDFTKTVKRLIEDDVLYQSISEAAIENARANFAMNRLHAAVLDVYKTLS